MSELNGTHEIERMVEAQQSHITVLQETITMLELALQNADWRLLTMQSEQEFTRSGLRLITDLARIMYLKNPIIKRGVDVQRLYVWAQGVTIRARDEDVSAVVQAFLSDDRNRAELTSHQERGQKEQDLQTDANLFFQFFTHSRTGRVRVRTIDPQEIDDVICNPNDKREAWFYKRMYTTRNLNGTVATHTEYYPDFRYLPVSRTGQLSQMGGGRIVWEQPVYHVVVNRHGRFGVSEIYAALDWAKAYKSFLENLATVWQALARFAWNLKVPGGKSGISTAKSKLGTTLGSGSGETNPPPTTASTFISSGNVEMKPISTGGATMKADDGRRLFLMAAMTLGFPETFYADANVGSLATAKSLDRPTELKIVDRQTLWKDIHQNIFAFVLKQAVKAPQGALRSSGRIMRERDGNQWYEWVEWHEGVDPTIEVTFPSVISHDLREQIDAIVDATTLKGQAPAGAVPLEKAVERLLTELGFVETDAIMELWREEQKAAQGAAQDDVENQESVAIAIDQLLGDLREAMDEADK